VYVGGPRWGYYNAYAARPINQYNIQRNVNFNNGGVNNFRPGRPVNGVMPVFAPRVAPVTAANKNLYKPNVVKASVPPGSVQKNFVSPGVNPQQVSQARTLTQTQALKASPAKLPSAQARAISAGTGVVPNAGALNTGAPKNQLSPQNAARIQANQAGKGLPATIPGGAAATGAQNASKVGGALPAVQNPAAVNTATGNALKGTKAGKGSQFQTESATGTGTGNALKGTKTGKGSQYHTESATGTGAGTHERKTKNAGVSSTGGGGQPKVHNNGARSGGPKPQVNKPQKQPAAPKTKAPPKKKPNT
jgi:hypothetical protein